MTYSNPRTDLVVNDWPTGSYKTVAHFWIEANPKLGERAIRTTAHPTNVKPLTMRENLGGEYAAQNHYIHCGERHAPWRHCPMHDASR